MQINFFKCSFKNKKLFQGNTFLIRSCDIADFLVVSAAQYLDQCSFLGAQALNGFVKFTGQKIGR